jgi:23S rRNA (adenine2503-C2)-methyltransferase
MNNLILCGLTAGEIFSEIGKEGFTLDHALKISNYIYKRKGSSVSAIDGIPKKLKERLGSACETGTFGPVMSEISKDETVKYLFITKDGRKFETVYLPDTKRNTVCVSSQSGCRMGCPFCATGNYGFHGNLTAGEIVNQVLSLPVVDRITHVVFMGMGEPMDNIENVLQACTILTAEWGFALSPGNITVSSVGITPGIIRFLNESKCNLSVSLFSPFHEERKEIVPAGNKYPFAELLKLMKSFPVNRKRRFTFSYMLIRDVNDTEAHLTELIKLLKGSGIRINLLPFHNVPGNANTPSSPERLQYFKHSLVISGISASIRKSRGADISAACGLLASRF